jgi:hypothetical protein
MSMPLEPDLAVPEAVRLCNKILSLIAYRSVIISKPHLRSLRDHFRSERLSFLCPTDVVLGSWNISLYLYYPFPILIGNIPAMAEACCTCATLLSSITPLYDSKTEKPVAQDRRLECCSRVICGTCIYVRSPLPRSFSPKLRSISE